jgi:hypothetical protein
VITRVSDRLQKKLDGANSQIREQNNEIKEKNTKLTETISELAKARVGKKASTIMLTVALTLFILEQLILQPFIEERFANLYYLDFIFLIAIFFIVKLFESKLEDYFITAEKKRIMKDNDAEKSIELVEITSR